MYTRFPYPALFLSEGRFAGDGNDIGNRLGGVVSVVGRHLVRQRVARRRQRDAGIAVGRPNDLVDARADHRELRIEARPRAAAAGPTARGFPPRWFSAGSFAPGMLDRKGVGSGTVVLLLLDFVGRRNIK